MSGTDKQDYLSHRTIMVTGASDVIGRQAALSYAQHGAQLILLGRSASKLADTAKQITQQGGKTPHIALLDMAVATPEACQLLATELRGTVPKLDGLLHNAGILGEISPIASYDPQLWSEVIQINLHSAFYLTQALLPLLLTSHGSTVVFTSSGVGRQGRANWGAYSVSKFATEGLTQVLADEYPVEQLRVNCINPGRTRTAMRAQAAPDENPAVLKTAADIMPLYLWLMSDNSQGITGKTFDAQSFTPEGVIQ
ncbi:MAG: putative oxidoreductase YciK [Candidatus Erwinia impunctatus]